MRSQKCELTSKLLTSASTYVNCCFSGATRPANWCLILAFFIIDYVAIIKINSRNAIITVVVVVVVVDVVVVVVDVVVIEVVVIKVVVVGGATVEVKLVLVAMVVDFGLVSDIFIEGFEMASVKIAAFDKVESLTVLTWCTLFFSFPGVFSDVVALLLDSLFTVKLVVAAAMVLVNPLSPSVVCNWLRVTLCRAELSLSSAAFVVA